MVQSTFQYTREDGSRRFVHDKYHAFFTAKEAANAVNSGRIPLELGVSIVSKSGAMGREFFSYSLEESVIGTTLYEMLRDRDLRNISTITDINPASGSKKVIVCIDQYGCYCNPDAQLCIKKLLEHIDNHYGINLLCSEGTEKGFLYEPITRFPDKRILDDVTLLLFHKGQLTAVDLFGLMDGRGSVICGVEDKETYFRVTKGEGVTNEPVVDADLGPMSDRYHYWAKNTLLRADEISANLVILVYSNTMGNIYDTMAGYFNKHAYSSLALTHIGPKGLGKNYWKMARGEPVDEIDRVLMEITK